MVAFLGTARTGRLVLVTGVLCFALGTKATAGLLVEEAFDYIAAENIGDDSLAGASGGIGWFPGVGWETYVQGGTDGYIEVTEGSLTLSDFPTSGNHVEIGMLSTLRPPGSGNTYVRPSRKIGVTRTSGDLWASFLYRRVDDASINGNSSRWAEIRDNEDYFFAMDPKATGSQGIRIRYDNGWGEDAEETSVQDGSVYLMVAKFANLGTTDRSGSGLMWALSEANYDAIKADGITEAEIDANYTLKAVDNDPGQVPRSLYSGDIVRFLIGSDTDDAAANFPFQIAFDELRYGTTLVDVLRPPSSRLVGDMDLDNDVDFDDIDDFVFGLNDPGLYESTFGVPPVRNGDTDGDGDQDFDDIPGFVDILIGGESQSVPEASTLVLAAIALMMTAVKHLRSARR
ncbi:MAG: hypothetical protein ACC628_24185 [Pirellulaceae bacterium]